MVLIQALVLLDIDNMNRLCKCCRDTWREFIAYNTSRDFKDELIRAFRTLVEHYNTNKGWKEDHTKYTRADVSPRMESRKVPIRMEMQFVCNAIDNIPIRTPT